MKIFPKTKRGKAAAVVGAFLIYGVASTDVEPKTEPAVAQEAPSPAPYVAPIVIEPSPEPSPSAALLFAATGGDGDSWKNTDGTEIRLGLINTPEIGGRSGKECYGDEASARRKELVEQGYTVQSYAVDNFDRAVSVVTLKNGTNLNVRLAQEGFANDRYLAEFRSENEALAAELDVAFAQAKAARRGLWGDACAPAPAAPAPAAEEPAAGAPFKNCAEARAAGQAPVRRGDPGYSKRIDRDGDGVACE